MTDQPKALRVAQRLEEDEAAMLNPDSLTLRAARLLREQHEEIEQLRAHLSLDWKMISEQRGEIEQLREQLRLANIDASNEAAENEALRRDAALVAAAEREAVLKMLEDCLDYKTLIDVAEVIRARGET